MRALAAFVTALAAATGAAPALADPAAGHGNSPRVNYLLHCAGCHLADGAGKPDRGIPDMRGQIGHYLRTPDGRAYLAQVPGVANSALSNREIADVLTWMVPTFSRAEAPAASPPYTEAEVAALRASVPADIPAERARVIARLNAIGLAVR
ncbi:c-type cytochrome [Derxia gummosa]|uniref:C-type cytochrome n=1 Tax=Derxia gummosa DSM 723 TaxID=1121388 RepID=A0A8B6XA03_9BURK|nr:hypothetical protein [Derxia gummosa]